MAHEDPQSDSIAVQMPQTVESIKEMKEWMNNRLSAQLSTRKAAWGRRRSGGPASAR